MFLNCWVLFNWYYASVYKGGMLLLLYYFICNSYDVIKIEFNVCGSLQAVAEHHRGVQCVHDNWAIKAQFSG